MRQVEHLNPHVILRLDGVQQTDHGTADLSLSHDLHPNRRRGAVHHLAGMGHGSSRQAALEILPAVGRTFFYQTVKISPNPLQRKQSRQIGKPLHRFSVNPGHKLVLLTPHSHGDLSTFRR